MKRFSLLLLTALLLPLPAQAASGLVLKFSETQKTTTRTPSKYQVEGKPTQMESATTSTGSEYTVTLTADALSIHNGAGEDLYDFAGKRYYRIQHDKKTYFAYPLQALPLYRHALKDRMMASAYRWEQNTHVTRFTKAGGAYVEDVKGLNLDLETIYGSASDSENGGLIHTSIDGVKTVFTSDYGPLAAATPSATPLPAEYATAYRRFLAYGPVLHADVEKALANAHTVPQTLDYQTRDHFGHDVSSQWVLEGTSPAAAAPALPQGYTQLYATDADLNASIDAAQQPGPTEANYETKINGYVGQHDDMRIVLSLYEMLATLPGSESDKGSKLMDSILRSVNDPGAQKTMMLMGRAQTTAADIASAEATLKQAKLRAPDYGYFIDLFRARNMRAEISPTVPDDAKMARVIAMDANALLVNPWLVPAYADLGDANFQGGDGLFAWTAWEQAQRLKPDPALAAKMKQVAQKAEADFPEYF